MCIRDRFQNGAHDGVDALIHRHILMHDHREAVEVLDINIADRALCDAAGVEEAGLGRDNDGVGPRGNAGIAHAGFQIAVPVGFAQSLTADDLVHARRPKPAINDGAQHRFLARGADEAAGIPP